MGRRKPRNWKPAVERVERRELLSLVTNIMAGNHNAAINSPKVRALLAGVTTPAAVASPQVSTIRRSGQAPAAGAVRPSTTSIALPAEPGLLSPANPGYNLILQPTGTATPGEVKRQLFTGRLSWAATSSRPGPFSSQAAQVFIAGRAGQLRCSTATSRCGWRWPAIPPLQTTGAAVDLRPELEFQHRPRVGPGDSSRQCGQPRPAQSHH